MKHGLQDIDWKYVGACLARTGDGGQAEFFKAFIAECSTWGTRYQVEQQLAFVNRKLTKDEREVLGMLSYDGE